MRRVGLDSNVLAYLAGVDHHPADADKIEHIQGLLDRLADKLRFVIPSQALGELFTVLVRAGRSREDARGWITRFREAMEVADCGTATLIAALDLAVAHKLQLWDSLILSAAADVGCILLLSEDMQDGFSWRGVTIINPFVEPVNQTLADLLAA